MTSDFERLYIDGKPFEIKVQIENLSQKHALHSHNEPIITETKELIIEPTHSSKRTFKKSIRRQR